MNDVPQLPEVDLQDQVVDLAKYVEQAAYAQAVKDAVEELDWMSGTLVATAVGLADLQHGGDTAVGTVVLDPQQALAGSMNWRVRKILDLGAVLLAGAETLCLPED